MASVTVFLVVVLNCCKTQSDHYSKTSVFQAINWPLSNLPEAKRVFELN